MATGAEAIEAIAGTTGFLPATVRRAGRALREARCDLWPQSRPGGGRNASHVRPHHLTNIAFALMGADPITDAPRVIAEYRDLAIDDWLSIEGDPGLDWLAPCGSTPDLSSWKERILRASFPASGQAKLGDEMDLLIDRFARSADRGAERSAGQPKLVINLHTSEGAAPRVTRYILLARRGPEGAFPKQDAIDRSGDLSRRSLVVSLRHQTVDLDASRKNMAWMLENAAEGNPQRALVRKTTTIDSGLISVLGNLWCNTLRHTKE